MQLGFVKNCRRNICPPSTARHRFSEPGDEESDGGEMSDGEINKLVIITPQVKLGGQRMFGFHNISSLTIDQLLSPQRPKKHDGFDRTSSSVSRVKMSQDMARSAPFLHAAPSPPRDSCLLP